MAGSSAPAAEYGLDPCGERASAKRFGHEIVGAELEYSHFVVLVSFGGEDHDRNVPGSRTRAKLGQHAVAVDARLVQIQSGAVRSESIDLIQCLDPIAGLGHPVALTLQQVLHYPAQLILVFN